MTDPKNKRATLFDVAEQAGVSYQTVWRVVNKNGKVSEATRQRILEAIEQLGYQPNRAAQALVTRRSYNIKMVTFGLNHYGPAQMVISIEKVARAQGYQLILSNLQADSEDEIQQVIESIGMVDGVLLITPIKSELFDTLTQSFQHLPMVCIGTEIGSTLPSVVFDQGRGTKLATQHLIDLGHTQIAEVSGPLYWHDALARHESWLSTLATNRLQPGASVEGDWTAAGGYAAAQQLLDSNMPFTSLVVGNDQMAIGAMRALRENGLRLPEDVSIVGFDNIPESAYFEPPLTTVWQDFSTLGKQCMDYLIQLITEPAAPRHQWVLQPHFIERQSTQQI